MFIVEHYVLGDYVQIIRYVRKDGANCLDGFLNKVNLRIRRRAAVCRNEILEVKNRASLYTDPVVKKAFRIIPQYEEYM